MDSTRIMQQVHISTTLILVRFLHVQLQTSLTTLETCIASIMVVMLSHLTCQSQHVICVLTIRLAILLLLEEVRPLVAITDNSSLMVAAGMLSLLATVPPSLKASQEGNIIVSSVMYMYSDVLSFALEWREAYLTMLVLSTLAIQWISSELSSQGGPSSMYGITLQIGSMAIMSLVIDILLGFRSKQQDAAILFFLLLITIFHFLPIRLAVSTEGYLLSRVAAILGGFVQSDPWLWCVFLGLLTRALQASIGFDAWPTQVSILLCTSIAISTTLDYIQYLSMYDTLVTLKASALILQFIVHEITLLTF